jgi:predicted ATPase
VQGLLEDGALVRNGTVRITRSLSQLRLPPTVQGMLAARIDRLPHRQKELLQTLAVIGRESRLRLLRQVTGAEEVLLSQNLADLCAAEFIHEQPVAGDTEFFFKHALTHEVAYGSLLIERRKQLHEHVGYSTETLFADKLDDHVDALALHYSHSDNISKAIHYLNLAATQATRRSGYEEALNQLNIARQLLDKLLNETERSNRELELQITLGPVLIATKGFAAAEVGHTFARARELCLNAGNKTQLYWVLRGLWEFNLLRGQLPAAQQFGQQLLNLATEAQDPSLLLLASCAMGHTQAFLGDFGSAQEHLERGIALYAASPAAWRSSYIWNPGVVCLIRSAHVLSLIGFAEQAESRSQTALRFAEETSEPFNLACVLATTAWLNQQRRDARLTLEWSESAIKLSGKNGFPFWLAMGRVLRGWALGERGQSEEGIDEIHAGLDSWRATGAETLDTYWLALLAEACGKAGRAEEGLSALAEALKTAAKSQERWREAELHRLKGTLQLMRYASDDGEAEQSFRRAIEIAQQQAARMFELRATVSLARLLARQGRHDEAREMLDGIYNWFTEGFDTADLKEAKALIDELNR